MTVNEESRNEYEDTQNQQIPTIDVVGADDDDPPLPDSTPVLSDIHHSAGGETAPTQSILVSHEKPHSQVEGANPDGPDVPGVTIDTPSSPGGLIISTSPQSQPQGILLDVPSSRARSGSASAGSVTFSVSRPPSPSTSKGDDSSFHTTPPSPTLSTRSTPSTAGGHYLTTLALRENQPTAQSGDGSLALLHPHSSHGHSHMRKGSAATFASTLAGSDAEPGSPSSPTSRLGADMKYDHDNYSRRTSITIAPSQSPNLTATVPKPVNGDKLKDSSAKPIDTEGCDSDGDLKKENEKVKLPDDSSETLDTGVFPSQLTPLALARLVDPKSLQSLKNLGGVDGVLEGLGTDARRGLCFAAHGNDSSGTNPHNTGFEERRRVYGVSHLPSRKSKSLLQLMWAALKDKVLILLSIAAVVSLALGLFQDFGTPRETFTCGDNGEVCTEPPVDWVEGLFYEVYKYESKAPNNNLFKVWLS